ncbi:MAG: chromosome partitioning protein ParB, partial [Betaproteobacteria bacterium]|nr:chromosome partitioning protein ParB [Betaproteobacteria bacterium]
MKVKTFQRTLCLQPTQFSIGLLEVEFKVKELKSLKPRKLKKIIRNAPVPVVISPWKDLCIIDHHHFVFACWHADIARVKVKVV